MTGERPPAAAAVAGWRRRRRLPAAAADSTPPEYRSGFGADGVKALQAFVQKGGTLVTFGQAGDLPIQRFGLPLRNVVAGLPSKEFWSPGSTLRVRFDNRNPLAYGMPRGRPGAVHGRQPGLRSDVDRTSQDVEIFSTYVERDILQSGWLLGEEVIAKKAAAVTVKHGEGKSRADRLPSAASRSDARHVQAGVQRAPGRSISCCAANDLRGRATVASLANELASNCYR